MQQGPHICLFNLRSTHFCLSYGRIFFGGEVLYLLRSIGGTSHFIGECYVHGLMDGEAYALLDGGSHTVENFVIE